MLVDQGRLDACMAGLHFCVGKIFRFPEEPGQGRMTGPVELDWRETQEATKAIVYLLECPHRDRSILFPPKQEFKTDSTNPFLFVSPLQVLLKFIRQLLGHVYFPALLGLGLIQYLALG